MRLGNGWLPAVIAVGIAAAGCAPKAETSDNASSGSTKLASGISQNGVKKPDINEQMMEQHPQFKEAVQDQIISQLQKSNLSDAEKQRRIADIRAGKLPR